MNKKAQIGRTIILMLVIVTGIMVLALGSPILNGLLLQASNQTGLSGIEKIFIEHFSVVLIIFLTGILFIVASIGFGGSGE